MGHAPKKEVEGYQGKHGEGVVGLAAQHIVVVAVFYAQVVPGKDLVTDHAGHLTALEVAPEHVQLFVLGLPFGPRDDGEADPQHQQTQHATGATQDELTGLAAGPEAIDAVARVLGAVGAVVCVHAHRCLVLGLGLSLGVACVLAQHARSFSKTYRGVHKRE